MEAASPTLGEYTWKKYEKLVEHFKSCQLSFFYHQMKGPVTTILSLLVSPNSYVFSAQQIFPHTFMSTCTWFKSHTILHFKNTIPLPDILNSNLSYSYNPNRNTFQIPTCALGCHTRSTAKRSRGSGSPKSQLKRRTKGWLPGRTPTITTYTWGESVGFHSHHDCRSSYGVVQPTHCKNHRPLFRYHKR